MPRHNMRVILASEYPGVQYFLRGVVEQEDGVIVGQAENATRALSLNGVKLRGLLGDNPRMGYEVLKGLVGVVASRLADTRQMLNSERLLPAKLK